jgi:hypothetical protein
MLERRFRAIAPKKVLKEMDAAAASASKKKSRLSKT